jgi:EAL domain-containing protein (putative c-di-GMP-specific phosphodiesterase class I)
MRDAEAAQQKARDRLQGYAVYDPSTNNGDRAWADLKGKLITALENRDLLMYYQPQVDLQRGVLAGCEAVVRWHDTERGWISPELFIPIAERSDLIDSLTYWSLNVALREWFGYRKECCGQATVSVNLSARVLHSPEVVELVRRSMSIWGVTPESLVLEVTESAMMADPRLARRTLLALAELGVILSIDDFGTGYSSLAYLKDLPVSELKIDKSFVQHMVERPQDRKIVQSAIGLAHNLELRVVAEGIEDRQTLDMLTDMDCDIGQGYFISKPMPIQDLPSWITADVGWCAAVDTLPGAP